VRVGGEVREPRIVRGTSPAYPVLAKKARLGGTVVLEFIINEEGVVNSIKTISGHPVLAEAAIEAVRQWVYEPTLLNGVPIPVISTATITFELRPNSE
jgi:protein TonB